MIFERLTTACCGAPNREIHLALLKLLGLLFLAVPYLFVHDVNMYQTLTNVQRGEAVGLMQYIDNRTGSNLCVGLRSITYTVGWDNLGSSETFSWQSNDGPTDTLEVVPGL